MRYIFFIKYIIFKKNVAINVTNDLLDYIGVKKLIIKRINWRSMQGYENLQAFELECISDEDVELVIENGL